MKLVYKRKDLFTVPTSYNLCHCISSDFALGEGIARQFADRGTKAALNKFYGRFMSKPEQRWQGEGYCLFTPATEWGEFNLVTKEKYWHKPTLDTMEQALRKMKELLSSNDFPKKIAMPRIGCGLDRLKWNDVEKIIEKVFEDFEIDILVCDWK